MCPQVIDIICFYYCNPKDKVIEHAIHEIKATKETVVINYTSNSRKYCINLLIPTSLFFVCTILIKIVLFSLVVHLKKLEISLPFSIFDRKKLLFICSDLSRLFYYDVTYQFEFLKTYNNKFYILLDTNMSSSTRTYGTAIS